MPKRSPAPYTVGYGRPPVATRFRPGKSGNPRGRPRSQAPEDPALAELDPLLSASLRVMSEVVPVSVGGRVRGVAGEEAIVRSLQDRALLGDIRSTRILLELRAEAQARLAQVRAQSAGTDALVVAVQMVTGLLMETKLRGGGDVDGLAAAIEAAVLAAMPDEFEPGAAGDTAPEPENLRAGESAAQGDAEAVCTPPGGRFEDLRLYEKPPRPRGADRGGAAEVSEGSGPGQAPARGAEAIPPAAVRGGRGSPLIPSSQPLSGPGYGLGGAARPAPKSGTFK